MRSCLYAVLHTHRNNHRRMWNEDFSVFRNEKSATEATKINRAKLPRKARNLSKEQLQLALRKKKECNVKAQKIVERLLEPHQDEDEFLQMLCDINQCHLEDVIQERAITKLCGYPLCDGTLSNVPSQQYVISLAKNKVYDITERKNFCSGDCYKATKYVKEQMLTSPLWLREQEDVPNFKLITGRQWDKRTAQVKSKPVPIDVCKIGELKIVERTYPEEAAMKGECDDIEHKSKRDHLTKATLDVSNTI